MKERLKGFFIGACSSLILIGGVSFAAQYSDTVQRFYNNIKITLNGTEITPKDVNGNVVEPFIIDGTTYLPVRAISNALGLNVDWNGETQTVILSEEESIKNEENTEKNSVKEKITGLKSIQLPLFKQNDKYYQLLYNGITEDFIKGYYAVYNDDLVFVPDVDRYTVLSNLVLLANYDSLPQKATTHNTNPYFKDITWNELEYNGVSLEELEKKHFGEENTIWYSSTSSYTPMWIEYDGIKIYNHDEQNDYEEKDGIRYYQEYICLNDVFEKLGIDKEIYIGEYDGFAYIEFK